MFRKINKHCKSLNKRKQVEDLTAQLLAMHRSHRAHMSKNYTTHLKREASRSFYSLDFYVWLPKEVRFSSGWAASCTSSQAPSTSG